MGIVEDNTPIGWRAWYTEGRVFSSLETNWQDLPEVGVLCVRLYMQTPKRTAYCSTTDYYWYDPRGEEEIYAYDRADAAIIDDWLWENNYVKKGKWVSHQEMARAQAAMVEAKDWPQWQ